MLCGADLDDTWSTHHLGIFEFCLQICQTRVTNNQSMLAPSLLQAAINGLDEVFSSVQVQGIGFVCRPDGIKNRFNLTGDTEHLPVQIFDLTFPDEFPLENVNQAASQLINGMNNMKSLNREYFFCSERVNGITEGRDYPLYVVQPNRLRDLLEIFFRGNKAVKNALRCMELKCISKVNNGKVSMMKRACILAQVMSFIQVRAAAYDEPLRVVSDWSEDLQEVLLSVWTSEMPSKESLKILRKSQMTLLKASGVIPTVHYKDPRLNTPIMPSSPPFQSGDQQGAAEFAEEQSSSTSGRTTVSGRETDDSPEIGLITESTADYYAERPQN